MKPITIVFTKSKKKFAIGSLLIRWWTNKPYSHVARRELLPNSLDHTYFQASSTMVNYEHSSHFNKKHEIVKQYTIQVPNDLYHNMITESQKQLGAPYGTLQNLGIVIVDFLCKLGIKATNPSKKGQNCSEVLYRTIFQRLIPNLPHRPNLIKPHHIEEIILSNKLNII